MADQGTIQSAALTTPQEITTFTIAQGRYVGEVILTTTADATTPTVPTTGQLWPRGNP